MEIPLFVLALQIGFNAALNYRGYNGNLLTPSTRFVNFGQTRRHPDYDSYQTLPSRGLPAASDSEQSDDEYSSFEDYSFRLDRPLQSSPNQRRNEYLRYNTEPENDVSLELAPVGNVNVNNYADSLQSLSSSSRRTDPNFRRPYLRNGPTNVKQSPTRKYYSNGNYLADVSPIDKFDAEEETVNSLSSSLNRRRSYRNEYNNQLRLREPSPVKDIPDAYIDTILLVTDDDKPDEIPIGRPKLESPESTGYSKNNLDNRRNGDGYIVPNNLSPFRRLESRLRSRKLTNDIPLTRKLNSNSDDSGLESSLNDELFPDGDKTGQLTLLRLASLENLDRDSLLLQSDDRNNHNNRKSNRRNFRRLLLSPGNQLTLDEGVASELSDLLSETLNELNLVPVTLRRTGPSNNKNNRRENNRLSAEENNLSNLPILRLGSVDIDIPNPEDPQRRYHELANTRRNLRKHWNNREALRKLFDDNPVKNLVPYHEVNSNNVPNNRRNGKLNNYRRDDMSDELDTLYNSRQEDNDDTLDPDDNFSGDLSVLRSSDEDHLSVEPPLLRRSDESPSKSKDTDDTLHLEYPWNDPLSSNHERNKSQLRSQNLKSNTKDTSDALHLEFPWNDQLSSDNDKSSMPSALSGLRSKTHLRNNKNKDNANDTTDILHLEFPWNDELSPDNDKSKHVSALRDLKLNLRNSQLRSHKQTDDAKDSTDILHLEFPWNDELSPDNDKSKNVSAPRDLKLNLRNSQLRSHKQTDNAKDTTDILHLEFPWNDELSPDNDRSKKVSALRDLKLNFRNSQLRSHKQKDDAKDTTDILHLEFPWNDQLSPSGDKPSNLSSRRELKSPLGSPEQTDTDTADTLHLEFPWNDQLSSNGDKNKSLLRSHDKKDNTKDTTDTLHLEFPWNDALSPDENKTGKPKSQTLLRRQSNGRQDKEPKDGLKLEFPWNDIPSRDKPSSKKTAARTPDPFYVHPFLRNRNIKKHPNYFRRSYGEFTEGIRLEHLKNSASESHLRINRKSNDNQSLGVLPLAREENNTVLRDANEDPSAVITFPSDRKPERLRTQKRGTPPLLTTERPNDTESTLNLIGDKNDRITYNDTIIFPNN